MKQLSLVAFYGRKAPPLAMLLDHCRSVVAGSPLGRTFEPYRPTQVHATIVGMESLAGRPRCNRNLWSRRGVRTRMEYSNLAGVLGRRLPLTLRFGGFGPAHRAFESRGRAPYERSFQVHDTSGKVTLMGWPHRDGNFAPRLLAALRRDLAETCNVVHRYDDDNDLYLVLGTVEPTAAAEVVSAVESAVRDHLLHHPLDLRLELTDVSVVCYAEETLDPASAIAYPVTDPDLTQDYLEGLYDS